MMVDDNADDGRYSVMKFFSSPEFGTEFQRKLILLFKEIFL